MTFWLIAFGAVIVSSLFLILPLLRRDGQEGPDNLDLQVYRDQLSEVESDLARGLLSSEEAERTRTEISRRILAADKFDHDAPKSGKSPKTASRVVAALLFIGLLAGSAEIYRQIGANGEPDLPLSLMRAKIAEAQANRPSQAKAEARVGNVTSMEKKAKPSYLKLVEELRQAAAKRPNDLRGQKLLAENEARLGNFAAARIAQGHVIKLLGDKATASDYTDLAELMIIAAGGYVSPEAEHALGSAIALDRTDKRARYYSGLDLAQNGRADLAYDLWSQLLTEGPANAPWIKPIRQQIGDVARMAGIRVRTAPAATPSARPAAPGPTQAQINAAKNMSPAERQKLISTMVARLSKRLENQGGSASEWARLINAYAVLGKTDKARATLATAKIAYSGDTKALNVISAAAAKAGIGQ